MLAPQEEPLSPWIDLQRAGQVKTVVCHPQEYKTLLSTIQTVSCDRMKILHEFSQLLERSYITGDQVDDVPLQLHERGSSE